MNGIHYSLTLVAVLGGCATAPAPKPTGCHGGVAWASWLGEETLRGAAELAAKLRAAGATLPPDVERPLADALRWEYVRVLLLSGNDNYGEVEIRGIRDAAGRPLRLYRTGITADPGEPGSCFHSLLAERGVRHVINLYEGPMPVSDLTAAEREAATRAGATYHGLATDGPDPARQFRERLREHPGDPALMESVGRELAVLIRDQILRPDGRPPAGPVYLHCGGGMHRTSMLVGILMRCFGGQSEAEIEAEMKAHSAYRSPQQPGGYEPDNLSFVMGFDCRWLEP
jgi:hypothetical protein